MSRTHICISLLLLVWLPSIAPGGLLAHYPFDSDFTDASGNDNHLNIATGSPSITSAAGERAFGSGAVDIDSTTSTEEYLNLTSPITFGSSDAWSVLFWVRRRPGTDFRSGMLIGNPSNNTDFIWTPDNASQVQGIRLRSSANTNANFGGFPDDGGFHHWAIIADGAGNVTSYRDNVAQSSVAMTTSFSITSVGQAFNSTTQSMDGQIDELYIYDEAITTSKVEELFLRNDLTEPAAGLILQHRYDGDFSDASDSGNGGTPSGQAAITSDTSLIASGSGALALDGADDSYLALQDTITFAAADEWSASWWARHSELQTDRGMVMGLRATSSDFIWLSDDFGGLRFRSGNSTDHDFLVPQDTQLHHYALVADGAGTLTLYRDGQRIEASNGDTSFGIDTIGLGQPTAAGGGNFDGALDEIQILDLALDDSEVTQIYSDEKPTTPPSRPNRIRVFLLGGQSNADGRAAPSGLPTSPVNLQQAQEDVDFYVGSTLAPLQPGAEFGPEITLGRGLADGLGSGDGSRIAIIRYAVGGTDLKSDWKAGGDASTSSDGSRYVTFQQTVNNGLAALADAYPGITIEIDGMVWVQGEKDARNLDHAEYQTNLSNFIADVRLTYGAGLPFVVVRLSSGQTNLPAVGLDGVRAAQTAVVAADPQTRLIDSDGFGLKSDNLHFDAHGQQQIGSASAGALASFFPFPAPDLLWIGDGELAVSVDQAITGLIYTLQANPAFQSENWMDLESQTASGTLVVFSYSIPEGERRRFFRVMRSAP